MALTVRVEPDPGRPLGHARIVLGGTTTAAAAGGFRIMREGFAKPNLGPAGWDVTRSDLKPVSVEQEGAQVVLVVGPAVVRHMEAGPALLVLPSDGSEAALFWPDDIEYFDGELPTDDPVPQPPAPPPPAAPPSPPPRVSPPPPAPPQPPAPQPTQPEPVSPQPPNRLPLILLGLLLLALAAAAAWWFLVRKAEEPAPQPAQQQAAPQAPPVQQPQRPPAPPAPVWPDGTDGLSLREVVERAPNAQGLHAVALRRQQAGRHDDALVLFEEAAEKGHAPAMTALARLYDPNGFRPGQPFRSPDPRAAARYYRDAMQRGDAGAQAPRAALKAWLEEQAPRNQSAADALKEFWP
ncbi:MAG: hypothetical protein ACKOGH_11335 [Alphaproteobacteria bacterium]